LSERLAALSVIRKIGSFSSYTDLDLLTPSTRKQGMIKILCALVIVLTTTSVSFAANEAWRQKSISLIKNEPKVRDAIWSAPGSLWVSVNDDGTRRDGYAEYIWLLTRDAGRPGNASFIVTIMDHKAMLQQSIRKLGTSPCG
jgi:hypothetical protein